jgi:hypothetical protein
VAITSTVTSKASSRSAPVSGGARRAHLADAITQDRTVVRMELVGTVDL